MGTHRSHPWPHERAEKDEAMRAFKQGETRLLVATRCVIEVGVDVPDATVIVIEHAEHFGLSQLHQLRGRVGGDKPSALSPLLHKARWAKSHKPG